MDFSKQPGEEFYGKKTTNKIRHCEKYPVWPVTINGKILNLYSLASKTDFASGLEFMTLLTVSC